MSRDEAIEEICGELDRITERLDDLAFDLLREAVRTNADRRPELEKRVTRARRALERASSALRGASSAASEQSDTEGI